MLEEVPLRDLIGMFTKVRKSAVLVLRGRAGEGTITFRNGVMDVVSLRGVTVSDLSAGAAAIDEIGTWGDASFDLDALPPA